MRFTREQVTALFPSIENISNNSIKEKVIEVWYKALHNSNWQNISEIPFYPGIPTTSANLIKHTCCVADFSKKAAESLRVANNYEINMDYVIAGALLHDVSKAVEYDGEGQTKLGSYIAHGVYSVALCLEANLPLEVVHIVASHTKQMKVPVKTLEALIVHYCDHLDANCIALLNGKELF
jgi:putative nucleotidyltransferase with HDIG domain